MPSTIISADDSAFGPGRLPREAGRETQRGVAFHAQHGQAGPHAVARRSAADAGVQVRRLPDAVDLPGADVGDQLEAVQAAGRSGGAPPSIESCGPRNITPAWRIDVPTRSSVTWSFHASAVWRRVVDRRKARMAREHGLVAADRGDRRRELVEPRHRPRGDRPLGPRLVDAARREGNRERDNHERRGRSRRSAPTAARSPKPRDTEPRERRRARHRRVRTSHPPPAGRSARGRGSRRASSRRRAPTTRPRAAARPSTSAVARPAEPRDRDRDEPEDQPRRRLQVERRGASPR